MDVLLSSSSAPPPSAPPPGPAPNATTPPGHRGDQNLHHRLSHLDQALYQDFYLLWVTLMVLNSLMFVAGVSLNGLALSVFCRLPGSAPAVYTVNLAVADLLVALSLPARVALYHSGGSCLLCSYLHAFGYFVNMYCSILFLTGICVDRYLAVVVREASRRRWRGVTAARCASAGVWLFAVTVTWSFQSMALDYSGGGGGGGGSSLCCSPALPAALLALTALEFLLPLAAISFFTLRVACALADRRLPPQGRARRRRAVRLLLVVLLVFVVCFTPFHVRQALVFFGVGGEGGEGPGQVLAYHATVTLSSLNSCLDPVVYCFVTDRFRAAVRRGCGGRRGGGAGGEGGGGTGGTGGGRDRSSKGSGTAIAIAHSGVALTLTPCNPPPPVEVEPSV